MLLQLSSPLCYQSGKREALNSVLDAKVVGGLFSYYSKIWSGPVHINAKQIDMLTVYKHLFNES